MFDTPPRDLADDPLASVSAATQLSADATLLGSQGATARRAAEELEVGTMVGRYVVLGKLGAGGMGVVYAAYDPELDRKVAVKLLRAGVGASFDARTRLLREAQALARLGHPNVVAVHDTGSVGERVWLAMEFVEGQTFAAWCAAQPERRSRWREVLAVMLRAGRGLQAAHEAGLIHRDFKPESGPASQVSGSTSVSRLRRGYVPTLYQAHEPVNTEQGEIDRWLARRHSKPATRACDPELGDLRTREAGHRLVWRGPGSPRAGAP